MSDTTLSSGTKGSRSPPLGPILALSPSQTCLSPSRLMRRLGNFSVGEFEERIQRSLERDKDTHRYGESYGGGTGIRGGMAPSELYLRSNPSLLLPEVWDYTDANLWRNASSRSLMMNAYMSVQRRIRSDQNMFGKKRAQPDISGRSRTPNRFPDAISERFQPEAFEELLPPIVDRSFSLHRGYETEEVGDDDCGEKAESDDNIVDKNGFINVGRLPSKYTRPLTKMKEHQAHLIPLPRKQLTASDLPVFGKKTRQLLPERFVDLKHPANCQQTTTSESDDTKQLQSIIGKTSSKFNEELHRNEKSKHPVGPTRQKSISIPTAMTSSFKDVLKNGWTSQPTLVEEQRAAFFSMQDPLGFPNIEDSTASYAQGHRQRSTVNNVNPHIVNIAVPLRRVRPFHTVGCRKSMPNVTDGIPKDLLERATVEGMGRPREVRHGGQRRRSFKKLFLEVFSEKKRKQGV